MPGIEFSRCIAKIYVRSLSDYSFWVLFSGKKRTRKQPTLRGEAGIFLKEFDRQTDEGCLVLHKKDMFPVFEASRMQELTGAEE